MAKERLDVLLVSRGLAESREKSKSNYYVRKCLCRRSERRQGRLEFSCGSRDRGPRQYIKIRKPRWLKIRKKQWKISM